MTRYKRWLAKVDRHLMRFFGNRPMPLPPRHMFGAGADWPLKRDYKYGSAPLATAIAIMRASICGTPEYEADVRRRIGH